MKPRDRSTDALNRLIAEARKEETPAVDWDRIEASLVERAAVAPRARARVPRGISMMLAAAVLGAVGGFWLLRDAGPKTPDAAPVGPVSQQEAPRLPHHVDGDALSPGAVVTSGAEALAVEHKGHATWTLAPESAAHVESVGEVVAVALDRGAVSAEVVKSFVVRIERTRVAVHGTRFIVTRLADSVRVDVEEGVVGVGPVGKKGFELRAPDGATVNFDGIRTDLAASASEGKHAAQGTAPAGAGNQPRQKSVELAPLDEDGMPRGALAGIEQAISGVERCLRENTVSGGDLRVSVQTRMTLRVDAKGTVGEALFAPPLAPNVGACVDGALEKIGFPKSTGGFVVDRVLELNR
jgi:hypothetical protein